MAFFSRRATETRPDAGLRTGPKCSTCHSAGAAEGVVGSAEAVMPNVPWKGRLTRPKSVDAATPIVITSAAALLMAAGIRQRTPPLWTRTRGDRQTHAVQRSVPDDRHRFPGPCLRGKYAEATLAQRAKLAPSCHRRRDGGGDG